MNHYFEPYKGHIATIPGLSGDERLNACVSFYKGQSDWFTNATFKVVIIGASEARNSVDNKACDKAPDKIRHYLYALSSLSEGLQIGDAGNIRGNSLNDRYRALQEAVSWFVRRNIAVLVIGGSQDLTLPMAKGLLEGRKEGTINLAVGDAVLDIDVNSEDFSSRSWLSYLINELGSKLEDLVVFGTQAYLCSDSQRRFLDSRHYEMQRLGDLRGDNIRNSETLLRDAQAVSIDFRMIKNQPQFGSDLISKHGIEPFDICRILRYAGISERVAVTGIFDVYLDENAESNAMLAAQMLWHFLDGFLGRAHDYPDEESGRYRQYLVPVEGLDEVLSFCRNSENDRWWMKAPQQEGQRWVACSRDDYRMASRNEIPTKWWRLFRKHSETKNIEKNE